MARILNISGAEIKDRGIQKLADYVEANLPDDFTLVIGCKPSIYDVDAVLIGKGNIFAIECKDWKGNIKGGSYGWWQKNSQVIDNPLHQARNNAAALGKWLRDKINRKNVWVQGLVVFTHEEAELNIDIDKKSNSAISILNINTLKGWIAKRSNNKNFVMGKEVVMLFRNYREREAQMPDNAMLHVTSVLAAMVFIIVLFSLNGKLGFIALFAALFGLPLLWKFYKEKVPKTTKTRIAEKNKNSYFDESDEAEHTNRDYAFKHLPDNLYYTGNPLDKD
jgi:hypothetical protein